LILTAIPAFSTGTLEQVVASPVKTTQQVVADDQISTDIQSIERLYRYVDSIYYEDVDKEKVFEGLASAMIASLGDRYSFYIPPSEAADYEEGNIGIYGGIGTYLNKPSPEFMDPKDPSSYMITIITPFPGSPAQRAGLMAGDLISHIDGEKVDDLTSIEASKKLRGEPNTEVTITVYRNGSTFDLTLKREKISTPTVEGDVIDKDIGYVILYEYTPQTGVQLQKKINELTKKNIKGLIIDERNNSGGAVDGALQSANIFLPSGKTLVTIQGKKGTNNDQRYISTGTQSFPEDIPIVILTNGGSASSSEIFAAALHDNKRATLVGTKTFGKGIVQDVFKFGEGFAQITTAHYYTPDNINIHGLGIEPDILVEDIELQDAQIPAYEQLMKDKVIASFAKDHPEPTAENIKMFAEENKDRGIDTDILSILMRNEYYGKMAYEKRPIGDLVFDTQLKRGVDFLRTGK
jgi:carboxyl-terminal processing protease